MRGDWHFDGVTRRGPAGPYADGVYLAKVEMYVFEGSHWRRNMELVPLPRRPAGHRRVIEQKKKSKIEAIPRSFGAA